MALPIGFPPATEGTRTGLGGEWDGKPAGRQFAGGFLEIN